MRKIIFNSLDDIENIRKTNTMENVKEKITLFSLLVSLKNSEENIGKKLRKTEKKIYHGH